MDKKQFIDQLFAKGKEAGFKDMEVFCSGSDELEIMVFKGDVHKYAISQEEGLGFRGLFNGKMGYAYTEKLNDDAIMLLVNGAKDSALMVDAEDKQFIHNPGDTYVSLELYNSNCEEWTNDEKIEATKRLEAAAYEADERVDNVNYCLGNVITYTEDIVNSKGLSCSKKGNAVIIYISVIAKEGDEVKTGSCFKVTNDYKQVDVEAIARKAVREAVSEFGADSVPSDTYPVVLENKTAASLLAVFAGLFSADAVHKKMSLLGGKLDTVIANEIVTIVDDPHLHDSFKSTAFDAEGVATYRKEVVSKGKLMTYLHNLKTAYKDGVKTTGNASRGSYKSAIDIAPSNFYIEAGEESFDAIIGTIENGLLINNLEGLHSGVDPISGDFSLSASGKKIENGKVTGPVDQITVSGNIINLLKNIEKIGSDLEFGLPFGVYAGSPSLYIKGMSVAGK